MGFSQCTVSLWNIALFGAGVGLSYYAQLIIDGAIEKLPDYLSTELKVATDTFDEYLLYFGIALACVAAFGFIGVCCKNTKMILLYILFSVVFMLLLLAAGGHYWYYRGSKEFPPSPFIVDDAAQILTDAFALFCTPYAGTDAEQEALFQLKETTYVKPLVDLGIEECVTPPIGTDDETCKNDYQTPCEEGVIVYTNENLFWTGIILLCMALVQAIIIIFSMNLYSKARWKKKVVKARAEKKNARQQKDQKGKRRKSSMRHRRQESWDDDSVYDGYNLSSPGGYGV